MSEQTPLTRRDKFGRLLAPNGVKENAEIVLESPSGEMLHPARAMHLGVDPKVFTDDAEGKRIASRWRPAGGSGDGQVLR